MSFIGIGYSPGDPFDTVGKGEVPAVLMIWLLILTKETFKS